MTAFTSFLSLSGNDKKLIINTLILMMSVRLKLWLMPFSRIQESIADANTLQSNVPVSKLVWSVKVSSNYVPRATCLTKALTGHSLLSRHGYPSLVKIGVGKSVDGEFEAHAWLEYAGDVVIGESEKEYIPLLDLKD